MTSQVVTSFDFSGMRRMCTGTVFLILAIAGLFTQFPCWSSKLSKVSVMIAESRTVVLQFHCLVIVCEVF